MNNAPFSIGQKVVCVKVINSFAPGMFKIKKQQVYTIARMQKHRFYKNHWAIGISENPDVDDWYFDSQFAPLQYNDATSEILEKFKQTSETPDKIIVPQTETV